MAAVLALALGLPADRPGQSYVGRPLEEALRDLQSRGLRILYSSDLVRPDITVKTAPRATSSRGILDELLSPHGLEAQPGPGGVLLVVKGRSRGATTADAAADGDTRFQETVVVSATREAEPTGPPPLPVRPADVMAAAGGMENVFRVAQTLPGVAAVNDFDSRTSVRGGGPDQNLTVLDGVEIHNPFRLSGLVSAFNPETVERFELSTGAYDVSHGDRLSSLLVVHSRAGSRSGSFAGAAAVSTTDANLVVEGRLPGGRGSWLATARRTYYDAIGEQFVNAELPSFADAQAKLLWEPKAGQSLSLLGLYGTEATDYAQANAEGEDYAIRAQGRNALAAVTFASAVGEKTWLRTVASFYRFTDGLDFGGTIESDARRAAGSVGDSRLAHVLFIRKTEVQDVAFRQEVTAQPWTGHALDGGFEAHLLETRWSWQVGGDRSDGLANGSRLPYPAGLPGSGLPSFLDSSRSGNRFGLWVQDRIQVSPRLALQPGLRLEHSRVNRETTLSPRLAATLALGGATRLQAAVGVYHQSPGYEKLFQADYFVDLTEEGLEGVRNERSLQAVVSLQRDFGHGLSGSVEAFYKSFSGLIVGRLETPEERRARLARYDVALFPSPAEIPTAAQITSFPVNAGDGAAHGIELYLTRKATSADTRLTGWLSYSFGVARREAYGRTYPVDYDRPQAGSLAAQYQVFPWMELAATVRVASGFPLTPALGVRVAPTLDAADVDGDGNRSELVPDRDSAGQPIYTVDFGDTSNINTARLPLFARVDARLTFRPGGPGGRWTIYLDVINLFDRQNTSGINPIVSRPPGGGERPVIIEEPLYSIPFLPSLGVRFRF